MVFINECKSCKISSEMFFNVMFLFSKTEDELLMRQVRKAGARCAGSRCQVSGASLPVLRAIV